MDNANQKDMCTKQEVKDVVHLELSEALPIALDNALAKRVGKFMLTVDTNHPLAGQGLNFDINIVDVRVAEEEEISHGHAHGAGGHQH